jgi:hypothetical protein
MSSIEQLKAALISLRETEVARLLREGTEPNFIEAKPAFEGIVKLYSAVPLDFLPNLPQTTIENIAKKVGIISHTFKKISDFKIDDNNPISRRNQLVTEIKAHYNETFQYVPTVINAINILSPNDTHEQFSDELQIHLKIAEEKLNKLDSDISFTTSSIQKKFQEADETLKGIRAAAVESGITPQSQYFMLESKKHLISGLFWLLCSILIAIAIILYAIYLPFLGEINPVYELTRDNAYKSLNVIGSKTLIFAILVYFLILSIKSYNTHRHNAVVNKHRQNALLTYSAIVNATKDERHKDAVLNHAASCIFAPQESGYTKSEANKGTLVDVMPKITVSTSPANQ